jgi:hypothetical protein
MTRLGAVRSWLHSATDELRAEVTRDAVMLEAGMHPDADPLHAIVGIYMQALTNYKCLLERAGLTHRRRRYRH